MNEQTRIKRQKAQKALWLVLLAIGITLMADASFALSNWDEDWIANATISLVSTNSSMNSSWMNITANVSWAGNASGYTYVLNWYKNGVPVNLINMPLIAGSSNSTTTKEYARNLTTIVNSNMWFNASGGPEGTGEYVSNNAEANISINTPDTRYVDTNNNNQTWFIEFSRINTTHMNGANVFGKAFRIGFHSTASAINSTAFGNGQADPGVLLNSANGKKYYSVFGKYDIVNSTHSNFSATANITTSMLSRIVTSNYGGAQAPLTIGSFGSFPSDNFSISEAIIWNMSLSNNFMRSYAGGNKFVMTGKDLAAGENWTACITPNNGSEDGTTKCTNILTMNQGYSGSVRNIVLLNFTSDGGLNATRYVRTNGTINPNRATMDNTPAFEITLDAPVNGLRLSTQKKDWTQVSVWDANCTSNDNTTWTCVDGIEKPTGKTTYYVHFFTEEANSGVNPDGFVLSIDNLKVDSIWLNSTGMTRNGSIDNFTALISANTSEAPYAGSINGRMLAFLPFDNNISGSQEMQDYSLYANNWLAANISFNGTTDKSIEFNGNTNTMSYVMMRNDTRLWLMRNESVSFGCDYTPKGVPYGTGNESFQFIMGGVFAPIRIGYKDVGNFTLGTSLNISGTGTLIEAVSGYYPVGQTYSIVGVVNKNNGTLKLWVNNTLAAINNFTANKPSQMYAPLMSGEEFQDWHIGRYGIYPAGSAVVDKLSPYPANGTINNCWIFNGTLQDDEARGIKNLTSRTYYSNITDWRINNQSFAIINLNFDKRVMNNIVGNIKDASYTGTNATLVFTKEIFWKPNCVVGGCYEIGPTRGSLCSATDCLGHISIGNTTATLNNSMDWTVVLWIKTPASRLNSSVASGFMSFGNSTRRQIYGSVYPSTTAGMFSIGWTFENQTGSTKSSSLAYVFESRWYCIGVRGTNGSVKAFINGTATGSDTYVGPLSGDKGVRTLFRASTTGVTFTTRGANISIDEFMVFNKSLTDKQMKEYCTITAQGKPFVIRGDDAGPAQNLSACAQPTNGMDANNVTCSGDTFILPIPKISKTIIDSPPDFANSTQSWYNYSWGIGDEASSNFTCNLTINSTTKATITVINTGNNVVNATINLTNGRYWWNVTCINNFKNVNTSETFELSIDNQPPYSISTQLLNNQTYSIPGVDSLFSIDVLDGVNAVDTVKFTLNSTEYLASHIDLAQTLNNYSVTLNGLHAGTWNYNWTYNDTLGNTNTSANYQYIINKGQASIQTGTNTTTATIYQKYDVTCNTTNGNTSTNLNITLNNAQQAYGTSPLLLSTSQSSAGTKTYNCTYTEDNDYTGTSSTTNITINKINSTITLTPPAGTIYIDQDYELQCSVNTGKTNKVLNLSEDGTNVLNTQTPLSYITSKSISGNYTYTCDYVEDDEYYSTSQEVNVEVLFSVFNRGTFIINYTSQSIGHNPERVCWQLYRGMVCLNETGFVDPAYS